MRLLFTYLSFFILIASYGQTKIEILQADQLVYDRDFGKYQRCIGNVKFKQDEVLMDCDSAWFYEEVNKIEAFGNIHIRQKDSFDLKGNYLEYNGDDRIAHVEEEVVMTDNEMRLSTNRIDYDLNNKSAYYVAGGKIANGQDSLSSQTGTYYSRTKTFHFYKNVELSNPDYDMESDTLHYNTITNLASFFGPTYIYSEENTIFCNYGWYNTETNLSQFSKGTYIEGKDNKLITDSMVYNRNTGFGEAFRNIELRDTNEAITIYGQYGNYQRHKQRTLITGEPMAIKDFDGDSMYITADTMIDYKDSLDKRYLKAFHAIKLYKSDLQSTSDSMLYNFTDSTISFYIDPVVWSDSSQITGDTIVVYRNSEGIEKLHAFNNGFLIEHDPNAYFNQISGKTVVAYFKEKKLNTIHVNGNGQSVYYALEDSTNYSGVNDIVCGNMVIYTDSSNRISTITFLSKPKATFYPLDKFPASKSKLKGFRWLGDDRPHKIHFIRK